MNYLLTHPWAIPDHQDLSKGRNKTGQLRMINMQNWAYQNGTRQKIAEITALSQGWQSPKAWILMLTQQKNTLNLAAVCYGGLPAWNRNAVLILARQISLLHTMIGLSRADQCWDRGLLAKGSKQRIQRKEVSRPCSVALWGQNKAYNLRK